MSCFRLLGHLIELLPLATRSHKPDGSADAIRIVTCRKMEMNTFNNTGMSIIKASSYIIAARSLTVHHATAAD
jgi:hypothetical protein